MTGRVAHHLDIWQRLLRLEGGAEPECHLHGLIQVGHAEVEVLQHLLPALLRWPHRGLERRLELDLDLGGALRRDQHGPVVGGTVDPGGLGVTNLPAEQVVVELGQAMRVGAAQHRPGKSKLDVAHAMSLGGGWHDGGVSYDLQVYLRTEVGLDQLAALLSPGTEPDEPIQPRQLVVVRGARRRYSFTVEAANRCEPEDVPPEVDQVLLGATHVHEVLVEGSAATEIDHDPLARIGWEW